MSHYRSEKAVRLLVWVSIAGAIFLVFLIALHQESKKVSFYQPVGYIKKVRKLVADKLIKYDPGSRKIVFDAENAPEKIRDFYRQSYLKEDIKTFNEGNYWGTFSIKNRKIQLDIRAHQILLPYTRIRTWTGDLNFRNLETSAVLKNNHLQLQVIQPPRRVLPLHARDYFMVPLGRKGTYMNYGFLLAYGDMSGYFAQVEYIGDQVVLEVKKPNPTVAVENFKIPEGHNVRLNEGDIILFEDYKGKRDYFIFREKEALSLISCIHKVNGRKQRIFLVNSLPMAKYFANGIQRLVSSIKSRKHEENFNITLTVERKLHETIQNELVNFKWKKGQMKDNYAPACVTLMDIKTGDILALATYPDSAALNSYRIKRQLRKDKRKDSYINRLGLNQNFLLHPIGSAGKPMLASAIWTVHPFLSGYRITHHPPGKELNSTLGVDFDPPFTIFGHKEAIDRKTFFKYSCNLYMVNLFHLALAADETGDLKFSDKKIPSHGSIGKQVIDKEVDLGMYLIPGEDIMVNLPRSRVIESIGRLFNVEVEIRGANDIRENTATKYDTAILSPIKEKLFITDDVELRPLYSSCPEQINLRFNQVQRFRTHLISLDLGGAYAEWNNIKLAEAFARIVTRKKIKAKIILDIADRNIPDILIIPDDKSDDFTPEENQALDWVREGIQLPTTPGGTAEILVPEIKRLNEQLEPNNLRIKVFSKTGSPRKHDKGPNSAVYLFCILMEANQESQWNQVGGISGAIYIEDRGKGTLAVTLAQKIVKYVVNYLKSRHLLQF